MKVQWHELALKLIHEVVTMQSGACRAMLAPVTLAAELSAVMMLWTEPILTCAPLLSAAAIMALVSFSGCTCAVLCRLPRICMHGPCSIVYTRSDCTFRARGAFSLRPEAFAQVHHGARCSKSRRHAVGIATKASSAIPDHQTRCHQASQGVLIHAS